MRLEFALALFVEQADFDLGGVGRKQSEIRALGIRRRSKRVGLAFADTHQ